MLFAVRFHDDPSKMEVRQQFTEAHRAFLRKHAAMILIPGTLSSGGSLWIVAAGDLQQVEDLYHQDPFWVNGLRQSVEVNEWNKAFPEVQVSI